MYRKLSIAIAINTVVMFLLTYALMSTAEHFHANLNRAYMAVLMAMPMVVVMVLLMRSMYEDARLNRLLIVGAVTVFALVLWLARTQRPIGDGQFLRSMIPHHSSAILMCEEASLTDPEIVRLCGRIVEAQRREIAEMEALLARH